MRRAGQRLQVFQQLRRLQALFDLLSGKAARRFAVADQFLCNDLKAACVFKRRNAARSFACGFSQSFSPRFCRKW